MDETLWNWICAIHAVINQSNASGFVSVDLFGTRCQEKCNRCLFVGVGVRMFVIVRVWNKHGSLLSNAQA